MRLLWTSSLQSSYLYNDIQPSCKNIQILNKETSEHNSQFDLQEAVANVKTVENQINKEEACSDGNEETSSDSSEVKETFKYKVTENDINLNSKKDEVAMNEKFEDQLSIYKKVKPNSDTKPVEISNERKSISFSLVNDDLLEKYFKDDSASQIKEPDSIDESSTIESTLTNKSNKSVHEKSLNKMSVNSNDTGYNSNNDNQSKSSDNLDNDGVLKNSSMNNVEKSKEDFKTEMGIKFSSDEIKWNLESLSNRGWLLSL